MVEPPRARPAPYLAEWLLRFAAGERHASFVGDLAEEFDTRIREGAPWTAAWYWGEVFGATPTFLWGRVGGSGFGPGGVSSWRDLRHAARALCRRPLMTLIAVVTIGLGVGVNAAIFTLVDGIVLRPLPYDDPGRLALVWGRELEGGDGRVPIFVSNLDRVRRVPGIAGAASFGTNALVLLQDTGDPERVTSAWATGDLFGLLGVKLAIGRGFDRRELRVGAPVLIIGHRLWRSRFGGDPTIVGRSVRTQDGPRTIVGVAAQDFRFPDDADAWIPPPGWVRDSGDGPGATASLLIRVAPEADLATIANRLEPVTVMGRGSYQTDRVGLRPWVEPLQEHVVGRARSPLLLLLAASGALLLLACANVTHLLLARGLAREQEWALRTALGAGRGRIIVQVLTEGVLIAIVGGLLGLGLAGAALAALPALIPPGLPRVDEIAFDARVFGVMLLVAATAGCLSALVPAVRAARASPMRSLRTSGTGSTPALRHRLQTMLIVGEVALGTILVAGASLLLVTLQNLRSVDPGFRADVPERPGHEPLVGQPAV